MILTYEAQHAALVTGLSDRVNNRNWSALASDAVDLQTLETLIGKAPTVGTYDARTDTVMVNPLPVSR